MRRRQGTAAADEPVQKQQGPSATEKGLSLKSSFEIEYGLIYSFLNSNPTISHEHLFQISHVNIQILYIFTEAAHLFYSDGLATVFQILRKFKSIMAEVGHF